MRFSTTLGIMKPRISAAARPPMSDVAEVVGSWL